MNILILRIILLFYLLFSYSVAYSKENLNNVRVNSLNILKNNEINNFLNNKIISGFFSDGSDFREAYYSNNSYLFEMLSGQDKGQYEGKWGIDGDHICYLMQGSSNYDCAIIYWRQLNSGIYDIYYGDLQNVFARITQIEDVPKNNLLKDLGNLTSNQSISNQNQTQSGQGTGTAPEGTQNISQEDIVNIDVTVIKDGWHGDTSKMFLVGKALPHNERLVRITQECLYKGIEKVKPGITSWGQVKYGYAENVEQMISRLKYDVLYVENMSLSLDFKIMFYTLIIILKGSGK